MQKSIDEIICLVVGPEFMKIISREILPYGNPVTVMVLIQPQRMGM